MPIVRVPDGRQVRFPDDMPREQIKAFIMEKFPEKKLVEPLSADQVNQMKGQAKDLLNNLGIDTSFNSINNSFSDGFQQGYLGGAERAVNGVTLGGYDWANDKLGLGSKERKQQLVDEAGTPAKIAMGGTEFVSGMIPSLGLWKGAGTLAKAIPTTTKAGTIASNVANLAKYPLTGGIEGGLSAGFGNDSIESAGSGALSGAVAGSVIPATLWGLGKGIQKATPYILSTTTGASDDAIRAAYNIGKKGSESAKQAFRGNLTGKTPVRKVINDAEDALKNIHKNASKNYEAQKAVIFKDTTPLSPSDILNTAKKEAETLTYNGKMVAGKSAQREAKEILGAVNRFKKDNTIAGFDAMKRAVQGVDVKTKDGLRIQTRISNAIKDTIKKQNPDYKELQAGYSEAEALMKDIRDSLKLGRGNKETATRSILQSVRNNVNANFGNKLNAVKMLEKEGGKELLPALYGQELSAKVPRGLSRLIPQSTAILAGSMVNPATLLALPASSPRLVGELAYGLGKLSNQAGKIAPTDIKRATLLNIINELNRKGE
jgi:hypothetical protein